MKRDSKEIAGDGPRVIVGNPGTIAEMYHMAAGLAGRNALRRYVTPVATTVAHVEAMRPILPAPLDRALRRQLLKRTVHDTVARAGITRRATLAELTFVCANRSPVPFALRRGLMLGRNAMFDRGLARVLSPGDSAVVGTYGAALHTIRRARSIGVRSYLEYPIAHHRWAKRILFEEAQLVPEFAPTLQFHDLPRWQRRRLDDELTETDRLFVLSEHQRHTFLEEGVDPSKISVTPLGVDAELFRPTTSDAPATFRVCFVGQITQRKGISYLIEAFRQAAIPNSELLFVGQVVGTSAPWISTPGLRHLPHAARWELPAVYATSSVFVLPSLVEGFGLTALEAMACGVPVIVSTNTFAHDVVREGRDGYVVPIRDSMGIADRLRLLYEAPELLAEMRRAARERATSFTWEAYGSRVADTIEGATTPVSE